MRIFGAKPRANLRPAKPEIHSATQNGDGVRARSGRLLVNPGQGQLETLGQFLRSQNILGFHTGTRKGRKFCRCCHDLNAFRSKAAKGQMVGGKGVMREGQILRQWVIGNARLIGGFSVTLDSSSKGFPYSAELYALEDHTFIPHFLSCCRCGFPLGHGHGVPLSNQPPKQPHSSAGVSPGFWIVNCCRWISFLRSKRTLGYPPLSFNSRSIFSRKLITCQRSVGHPCCCQRSST